MSTTCFAARPLSISAARLRYPLRPRGWRRPSHRLHRVQVFKTRVSRETPRQGTFGVLILWRRLSRQGDFSLTAAIPAISPTPNPAGFQRFGRSRSAPSTSPSDAGSPGCRGAPSGGCVGHRCEITGIPTGRARTGVPRRWRALSVPASRQRGAGDRPRRARLSRHGSVEPVSLARRCHAGAVTCADPAQSRPDGGRVSTRRGGGRSPSRVVLRRAAAAMLNGNRSPRKQAASSSAANRTATTEAGTNVILITEASVSPDRAGATGNSAPTSTSWRRLIPRLPARLQ